MKTCVWLLLVLLLMPGHASAVDTINLDDVTTFGYTVADEEHLISSVNLNNMPQNSNATLYLDAYGDMFVLNVNNSFSGYGGTGWWTFDISLVSPNGSVSNIHKTEFYPYAKDADVKIQYFYRQLDTITDIDIYLGLSPLIVHFESPITFLNAGIALPNVYPDGYDGEYVMLAFYSVQGTSTEPVDFKVLVSNQEEFEGQQNNSLWEQITGSVGTTLDDVWGWTWNAVVVFIGKIPVIGPYLEISLTIAGMIFGEIAFYFNLLIIENWYIFFMVIETVILGDAIINTRTFWALLQRTFDNHMKAIKFALYIFDFMIGLWTKLVSTIAWIVQALKPV